MLLPHNEKYFNEIIRAYENNNDVLFIHGTGLGKSFIFLECAKTVFKEKKILFVVPKLAVGDGISSYDDYRTEDAGIEFKTYNYFKNSSCVKEAFKNYDVTVFDEAHHLGSGIYGKNARKLFSMVKKHKDKKILGLTATNVREDKTDVSDYFSYTVLGMGIFDGIRDGLIPSFEYLVCRDNAEQCKSYDRKLSDFRKRLDYESSIPLLKYTVSRNEKKRWICFFPDIKALETHERVIRDIFPNDYHILKITTKHSTRLEEIGKYERTVTLSVDKLLEGVHIPHTQGIILFRNVRSLPVFQQILGRVVHVGDTEHPLVIDCTETAIKILAKLLKEDEKGRSTPSSVSVIKKPVLYCSLQNTEQFNLTRLLSLSGPSRPWTEKEEKILRKNYKTHDYKKLERLLPGRTKGAIQTKLVKWGLLETREHKWTEEELNILKSNAAKSTISELCTLLPNKTDIAIKSKCKTLGLSFKKAHPLWTDEEIQIIKNNADSMTWGEIAALLPGRTKETVKAKAAAIGCDRSKNRGWTKEQEIYLKNSYLTTDIEEICNRLSKNKPAVRLKARQMGLFIGIKKDDRLWNDDKIAYLKEHYNTMNRNEISAMIDIPPLQVTAKAADLGLKKRA